MQWFKGGVPAAIASCRQQKALFIVYIHDSGAASIAMDQSWKSTEVLGVVSAGSYVALKIAKDSTEYLQFSQLFPVFVFPTVFCIGLMGQALYVMNGQQTNQQMADKLQEAFQKLQEQLSPAPQPSLPNGPVSPTPQPTIPPPSATPTTSEATPQLPEAPPPPSSAVGEEGGNEGAGAVESHEEKLRRYQEKMRQRREEREEEEFQKAKQQEIARRQHSRETERFRQSQEQRQAQSWMQERKKQKEEEKLAREEIRVKLEQDRLERKQRREQERLAREEGQGWGQAGGQVIQPPPSEVPEPRQRINVPMATHPVSSVMSSVTTSSACRIQLRLPAGRTSVLEMSRTDTLGALRDRAASHLGDSSAEGLSLTSVYPRKDLDQEESSMTLTQLQLVPSGVVIVRKKGVMSGGGGAGGGGGVQVVWGFLLSLFQLIVGLLTYLKGVLGSLFSGPSPQPPPHSPPAGASRLAVSSGRVRKFRQEDFESKDEDDDRRKGTYNGNSTQQQ